MENKGNNMDALLAAAELIADEAYGCSLDRLDPSEVEWFADRLTEDNFEELASDLAHSAWMAY